MDETKAGRSPHAAAILKWIQDHMTVSPQTEPLGWQMLGARELTRHVELLEAEHARAVADNAALVDLLGRAAGVLRDLAGMPMEADLLSDTVSEPHPGAALLEELRATKQTATEYLGAVTVRRPNGDTEIPGPELVKARLAERERLRAGVEWARAYLHRIGDAAAKVALDGILTPPKAGEQAQHDWSPPEPHSGIRVCRRDGCDAQSSRESANAACRAAPHAG
jgi:hypothetical protein